MFGIGSGFSVLDCGIAKRGKMTDMGEPKGPFGGTSHSSASAEDVWAVWTNPAEWPGDVIATAKIDGPFAVGAKITTRVKGYPPLTSTVTRIEPPTLWTGAHGLGHNDHRAHRLHRPDGFDCCTNTGRKTAEDF